MLGNPPWTPVVAQTPAADYRDRRAASPEGDPSDGGSAALFYWRALDDLCRPDGLTAFVMPAKALLAPSAKQFPKALRSRGELIGVTNLVSFRRRLFVDAEEAAVVLFASPRWRPSDGRSWRYSPKLSSQPLGEDGVPWAIVVDRDQVERFHPAELRLPTHSWRHDLLLQPMDRMILDGIRARGSPEGLNVRSFLEASGMRLSTGDSAARLGVDPDYVLGTNANDFRQRLSLKTALLGPREYDVPDRVFYGLEPYFRRKFGGPTFLQPRSKAVGHLVEGRAIYGSSLTGVYFPGEDVPERHRAAVLTEFGAYLTTKVGRYLAALVGRQWIIDERRFEAQDVKSLPFPYRDWRELLDAPITGLEHLDLFTAHAAQAFGAPRSFVDAVEQHHVLREPFQNGKMPAIASAAPLDGTLDAYAEELSARTSMLLAGTPTKAEIGTAEAGSRRVRLILGDRTAVPTTEVEPPPPGFAEEAGLSLAIGPHHAVATITKPELATAWTTERAFSDAIAVARRVMS